MIHILAICLYLLGAACEAKQLDCYTCIDANTEDITWGNIKEANKLLGIPHCDEARLRACPNVDEAMLILAEDEKGITGQQDHLITKYGVSHMTCISFKGKVLHGEGKGNTEVSVPLELRGCLVVSSNISEGCYTDGQIMRSLDVKFAGLGVTKFSGDACVCDRPDCCQSGHTAIEAHCPSWILIGSLLGFSIGFVGTVTLALYCCLRHNKATKATYKDGSNVHTVEETDQSDLSQQQSGMTETVTFANPGFMREAETKFDMV